MTKKRLGLAICGSYCTFDKIMPIVEKLKENYDITAIMSEHAAGIDTRFGCAANMIEKLTVLTGKEVITTIPQAEPIGPKKLLDILAVAPCTGNTLAKLACGITDSTVTMACKAHLRNGRPLLISVSTNDALGANAKNIGDLIARKNIFFVPFHQDDPVGKPSSMLSDLSLMEDALEAALEGRQLQPVVLGP